MIKSKGKELVQIFESERSWEESGSIILSRTNLVGIMATIVVYFTELKLVPTLA